jgi:hypothetical protein
MKKKITYSPSTVIKAYGEKVILKQWVGAGTNNTLGGRRHFE